MLDGPAIRAWIHEAARVLAEQRTALTDLDAAIGDGDHGVNMERGFAAAVAKVDALPADAAPGPVLRTAGAAVLSGIGGTSGPLWGMALRKASQQVGNRPELDAPALADLLATLAQTMQDLGKAAPGDKTLLDAMLPAAEAAQAQADAGAAIPAVLAAACAAADAGALATIPLQARKGRASYLGPRGIGHQDSGATSAALILRALESAIRGSTSPPP